MSAAIEDRVKRAHPLAPAHRMVLLAVAWQVPDGATEVLVNRTQLARDLDAKPELIRMSLVAGETLNLCRVLKNGRIAFNGYDCALGAATPENFSTTAIEVVPPSAPAETPVQKPAPQTVLAEFSKCWKTRYGRSYPFTAGKDHRLARQLTDTATLSEIANAARAYLDNEDPFYSECSHAFSVFHRSFHKFVVAQTRRPTTVVNDVEQTREYLKAMRAARGEVKS